ncbi:MAG TPA: osmotically inducible protein OsmC [Chloroflexi bacterium]|nr:osmotically inducible protein OsmC [Chloroflexota bacterium]
MEMVIDFPGGTRVDAHFGPYIVETDQPPASGGEGSAPSPFAVFLAAIGTCAGFYVLRFCQQRGLPADDIRIVQRTHTDPATGLISDIDLEIQVPESFPAKYYDALVRSAEQCKVKRHLENPPQFHITTTAVEAVG